MIVAIRSNVTSFKEIRFSPGFNVVLADRTKESTKTDSRNGLGKTTLIEIIHFCLGATAHKDKGLLVEHLKGWSFTLELWLQNRNIIVTRSADNPSRVDLAGDISGLSDTSRDLRGALSLHVSEWNVILGELFFGLKVPEPVPKYSPTFRSLVSYLVRRGRDSFASPFSHYRAQREWDKQVNNAFLLGLAWEHASQLQEVKDRDKLLNDLRRAAQDGLLDGMVGTLGNLEAQRARLDSEIRQRSERLRRFRVLPEYYEIEHEANELTARIQQLSNSNLADSRLAELYRDSLKDHQDPGIAEILQIYEELGISMPDLVCRQLSEVQEFHRQLLENRREYLHSEIQRIEFNRSQRQPRIQAAIDRRAQLLEVLQSHGALDEYTQLQELHLKGIARLNDINSRITNLRRFEQGKSELRVERELILQAARRDFEERRDARERAINTFNSNSEVLYGAPGNLLIDVVDTGFKFDVRIMRSGSQGINNMKIYCYDLMLAEAWATSESSAGFLIHDSTIFDGVDERQYAKALELAKSKAEHSGFQYVCALNTDTLPLQELSSDFELDRFVRVRFTDESEDGGLLGIRY